MKISNVGVYGLQYSIKAFKKFYNSNLSSDTISFGDGYTPNKNDLAIMRAHIKESNAKAKFARFIQVYFDVEAPLHWWSDFKDYKVGSEKITDPINRKLLNEPISIDSFEINKNNTGCVQVIEKTIEVINSLIVSYNSTFSTENKRNIIKSIKSILPHSYIISGAINLNYQTLRAIYFNRKESRSDNWKTFCQFIASLPYADSLLIVE